MVWVLSDLIAGTGLIVVKFLRVERGGMSFLRLSIPIVVSGLIVSGCVGSPTYGTGKASDQQLFEDVTGLLSIGPKNKDQIAYKPRPELVKPAQKDQLPAPQSAIANASNSAWPESPEERRARYREEATANQDNAFYDPVVENETARKVVKKPVSTNQRGNFDVDGTSQFDRDEFKRRLQESKTGNPTQRKYLSEPPLVYRQPAESAPTDDVGEDEWKRERRLKAESRKKSGKRSNWKDWLPWT